jgi:negative regulator of sigma E activity
MMNERRRNQDLELLSAYLDNELSPTQSQALEARLHSDPDMQARLEKLRQTKRLLAELPRLRAPRRYTLSPEMVTVRRPKKQPFVGTLRLTSALAAVMLVVMFGVEFLLTSGPLARPQMEAAPMVETALDSGEPQPLIVWGQPGAGGAEAKVNGMGGGVDMMEEPMMIESMPVEREVAVEDAPAPGEMPEDIPAGEPEIMLEAMPEAQEEAYALQMPLDDESGMPILGINPEEGGEIISRSSDFIVEETTQPAWRRALRAVQIALGAIAVGGGLAWWVLRRRN